MNKKLKSYKDFLLEFNQEEGDQDFFSDDEYNKPIQTFDEPGQPEPLDIQDSPDIEEEERENMIQVIYDKDTNDFFIDSELDEPLDYENFNDWFLSIDESETSVSMTENDEKNEIVYHLPEYLYVEYLEKEKESQEEEGIDDENYEDEL